MNRLRFYRTRLRLTQSELAKIAGRSPMWISMLETGRWMKEASPEPLLRLARYFNLAPWALLEEAPADEVRAVEQAHREAVLRAGPLEPRRSGDGDFGRPRSARRRRRVRS